MRVRTSAYLVRACRPEPGRTSRSEGHHVRRHARVTGPVTRRLLQKLPSPETHGACQPRRAGHPQRSRRHLWRRGTLHILPCRHGSFCGTLRHFGSFHRRDSVTVSCARKALPAPASTWRILPSPSRSAGLWPHADICANVLIDKQTKVIHMSKVGDQLRHESGAAGQADRTKKSPT